MWQTLTGPLCQLVTLLLCACDRFVDMKINMKKKLTLSCFVLFFFFFKNSCARNKVSNLGGNHITSLFLFIQRYFYAQNKKTTTTDFFFFNNFLIIFYCLSLIQTLKYEDKKLDLNNASYTNTHAEERERKNIARSRESNPH